MNGRNSVREAPYWQEVQCSIPIAHHKTRQEFVHGVELLSRCQGGPIIPSGENRVRGGKQGHPRECHASVHGG